MQDLNQKKFSIDTVNLRGMILEKFGTQANCAKMVGFNEPQLSKQLKKPSPKFLIKLKKAGLDIEPLFAKDDISISKLNEEIIQLKEYLEQKEKIIVSQNNIIKNYENIIKTLKGINGK